MLKLTPFKIVLAYVALSVLWIAGSDLLLEMIAVDTRTYAFLSILKGWLFIVVTATLLYGLISRYAAERNQAEEKLKASQERFKDLSDSLPQTVFETDRNGRITYVNKAGLAVFGYDVNDVARGVNVIEIVAPEERGKARENFDRRMRGEYQGYVEYTMLRKDGSTFPAIVHSAPILRQGAPMGLRGVMIDITERKQAETAVRESEEKYRFVVEHASDGVIIAQDGMLRFANPSMVAMTGYSVQELTRQPFTRFLHPEDRALVLDRHVKRTQGKIDPNFSYAFRLLTKDGRTVWVETRGATSSWNGRPATINFMTDITDRLRIADEKLQSEKLKSIGILAGGIAHDFNNILTGVLANISIVRRQVAADSQLAERLAEAESASIRARKLTQQLLTFSRGGAPVRKHLAPANLIRESATFALRGRGSGCDLRIDESLWSIEADEGQVGQVINNLVINASQAMAGGGTVAVSAANILVQDRIDLPVKNGKYVMITVSDKGAGIPPEHLSQIFDPYFTTKQEGSGLGLAISYSIVKNHGGTISVVSEPGQGTAFTVYLPATDIPALELQKDVSEVVKGRGRVLVMDDEELVRSVAGAIIGDLGFEVLCVADGRAAIEACQQAKREGKPFDVLILDLTVPGRMGGRDAMKELLVLDPNVKAIVSSGYHDDPIMANYREYGFHDVIAKPYDEAELSKAIARMMGRS
jgi:PAS domain S-box-containing protein